jgi:hypothetical protein
MSRAAVALAVALLLAVPAGASDVPLTLRASLAPSSVGVGDPFFVRVDVRLAGGADAADVRFEIDPGPFTALDAPRVERLEVAGEPVARATQRLACLGVGCLPGDRPRELMLPAARARLAGPAVTAVGPVLRLRVVPRVSAAERERTDLLFRRTTEPPKPAYRLSPALVTGLLYAAASAFALLGAIVVATEVRRRRRRERPVVLDPLVRAIQLARDSLARPTPDRRRATGLLARLLAERGAKPLAASAGAVAWSAPPPRPAAIEELAREAETTAAEGEADRR